VLLLHTGTHGNAGQANYATAKAGVTGLTKSIAKVRLNSQINQHFLRKAGNVPCWFTPPDWAHGKLRENLNHHHQGTAAMDTIGSGKHTHTHL
jgi:hypothetical protein